MYAGRKLNVHLSCFLLTFCNQHCYLLDTFTDDDDDDDEIAYFSVR